MRAAAVALLLVFVTCVLHTVVGSTTSCNQTCPAPVLSSVTLMNGAWSENPPNKSWDITWSTQYDSDTEAVDKCYGNDTNPNNYFNRTCSWTLECNQPNMTNSSVVFYNLSVDLSPSRSYTNVFFNLEFFKEDNVTNLKTLMFSMYNQNITGALQSGTAHNLAFPNSAASFPGVPQGQGYVLASSGQKAHIVSTFFTNADNGQIQNQTELDMNLAMHFECDQFSRCRTEVPIRNLTCPAPVLSNITQPPFVNGSWSIHPYNKSWDIAWYAEYNKSIDVLDRCYENDTNPYNFFNRTCAWTLECNKPNVTNGSVVFFNLSVDLFTPERRLDTNVFLNLEFFNEDNITNLTTFMFGMYNRTITGIQQSGTTHNFAFPNRATGIPDVPLGQGYILTSNWRQKAHIVATFFTNNNSGRDALVYQTDIGMNLSMHFECDQFFINVTVYEDDDILGVALGIPLGLIALLVLLAILKWKYPNMCNCCDKNRDGSDNFDDDEKILAAARARREGRDLAQPMMELQDKAGMQTWLDQAEDVVEDLNKNCLYLEEAKADSQMNKGFDALEAGVNPTMASHKDGFIGGRQLYAVGGASGGVKVIDHRPTMQTKGGGADEDPVL